MNPSITSSWFGQRDPNGPVTCAVCGCRLTEAQGFEGVAWRHFQFGPDTDARGCRPGCLGALHARDGTVASATGLDPLLATGPGPTSSA